MASNSASPKTIGKKAFRVGGSLGVVLTIKILQATCFMN